MNWRIEKNKELEKISAEVIQVFKNREVTFSEAKKVMHKVSNKLLETQSSQTVIKAILNNQVQDSEGSVNGLFDQPTRDPVQKITETELSNIGNGIVVGMNVERGLYVDGKLSGEDNLVNVTYENKKLRANGTSTEQEIKNEIEKMIKHQISFISKKNPINVEIAKTLSELTKAYLNVNQLYIETKEHQ